MNDADQLYDRLIAPIEAQMTGIVARIVRDPNDAADVLQEVLAGVWQKLARIDRHPNPHGYILRICVSRCYDFLRRRARRRGRESMAAARKQTALPVDEAAARREATEAVRNAIGLLPPQQGKAVLLRALDEWPYEAIARTLGCSEASARSHFSKGKARLRHILTDFATS